VDLSMNFHCGDVKKGENIINWGKYMSTIV
jgi:hypothetical protein